ncbi:DNase I-like protein [Mycena kentingensis (nom. inval.)]|nr:DNase I-like protein [Mycena kentingensis (nom. inval.)]
MKGLAVLAALAASVSATLITDINGASQRTPLLGATVTLESVLVTAKGDSGFYLRGEPVDDERVSYGLAVFTTSNTTLAKVSVGDIVTLTGRVSEFRSSSQPDYLLLTELTSPTNITVFSSNNAFEPIVLGKDRIPPTQLFSPLDVGPDSWLSVPNNQSRIDTVNGTLQLEYGLDFWQSLQGQFVSIPSPEAVGYPNSFGEFWVHGDWPVTGKNARGGLSLTIGPDGLPDANPEAVIIGSPLDGTKNPKVAMGTKLSDIVGVVTYEFGFYYVVPTTAPVIIANTTLDVKPTTLVSSSRDRCLLTVGDYNVENMAPTPASHIADVASHIGTFLRTPDLMFVQEIQDNSGPTDNGIVSANVTLSTLVAAIANLTNVTYSWASVDPVDGEDGGQPGGNIRNAYLYRAEKISLVQAPLGGPVDAVQVSKSKGKPFLSFNPGRVDPNNTAWIDSRKPLAAMWKTAHGETLFTVNVHFASKGGSSTSHGDARPPVNSPVEQRISQVDTVAAFVQSLYAIDKNANVIVAGDFNEYSQSRTVLSSLSKLMTEIDEVAGVPPVERYTYVFDQNAQQLDHMFVSNAIKKRGCAEVEHIHINNWQPTTAARVSDHDPSVAQVKLC